MIDLAPMRGIRVDHENKTGSAEGGVRWGEFDYETGALGLATTGGTVSTTGVGGLTLGGGLGWLMRKHGLSCDNLIGEVRARPQHRSDDAIEAFASLADAGLAGSGTGIFLEHMGGAIARVGEHDTAFSNRKARYNATILGGWPDAADDVANIAWTRASGDKLKSFATGAAYINYMTGDEGGERLRSTYEVNLERLVEVKRKYDPANFFSSNQNIVP
jgi:FAD/FMN-containing dehydrogenase